MINCNEFSQHLSDFVEGIVSRDLKKKMDNHVASCSSCAKVRDDFVQVLNSIKNLPKINASSDFEQRLREKIVDDKVHPIKRSGESGKDSSLKPFIVSVSTAAAIALIAFVINIKFINEPDQQFYSPRLQPIPMPQLDNAAPARGSVYQNFPGSSTTIGGANINYPDTSLFRYDAESRRGSSDPLWKIQIDTQSTNPKRER
ncbi:MAG: zf-HC2 domain-containing protein [bacterium]|nr:zf-HC2 domain-containing protein [bacterium]